MSDERFARQYRFGLPSGFPLTSSCTSIDHHLSGPNLYALARLFTKDQVLPEMRLTGLSSRFHCASGFTTLILAHKLDSLVRVSRRVGSIHKNPDLGDAQPRAHMQPSQPSKTSFQGRHSYTDTRGRIHPVASLPSTVSRAAFIENKISTSLQHLLLRHPEAI